MSRILITTYEGDAESYDWEQPDSPENIGNPAERAEHYRDGEEMLAVKKIAELLDTGTHFDVRQWRD